MSTGRHDTHPAESLLDRYVEQDLSVSEASDIERHLGVCPVCTRTVSEYRAFFVELNRLPLPQVPAGFSARILQAVLPRPSENVLLIRWATKAYVGLAVALAAVAATVLGVSGGPGPVAGSVANGFTRVLSDGFSAFQTVVIYSVDLLTAFMELLPAAEAAGSLARGLETATWAVVSQYHLVLVLILAWAAFVLVWATSPARVRERGVPHVSLL